jgi:hypothetical protein
MLVRFVSLVTLICAIAIALVNIQNSSDPLFFIVSGGFGADLARLAISGLMVVAATFALPKKMHPQLTFSLLGVSLIALGLVGFVMNSFNYALYDYIKPMDFLMLSDLGIMSCLIALEANKPVIHFYDPYRRAVAVATLPKLKKTKTATI